MEVRIKPVFYNEDGEKFFGTGPFRLLTAVEETGSLLAAAKSMDMAYTKAMKLLKNAEKGLGFPLTERMTGGKQGGGSRLTADGKEWMARYAAYKDALDEANRKLYSEFFEGAR